MIEAITVLKSRFALLSQSDIDTDQIIPARFMATTSREGLGSGLFFDARHSRDGLKNEHALNDADIATRNILLAGPNFGCGSSREHAVWALRDFGFQAVLSTKIADIFKANALNNGLLAIEVSEAQYHALTQHPSHEITIDLEAQTLGLPGGHLAGFELDGFARYCLLNGIDRLGYVLANFERIKQFEVARASAAT